MSQGPAVVLQQGQDRLGWKWSGAGQSSSALLPSHPKALWASIFVSPPHPSNYGLRDISQPLALMGAWAPHHARPVLCAVVYAPPWRDHSSQKSPC